MNVEQLIRQFLYENKSISLPGIGKLAFSGTSPLPPSGEKNENFPLPDLGFTYNLQEQAEPAFIAFVADQTGKIKPLATSDIDSFFTLAKQFINIGKSFIIDGVGVVNKLDNGQYHFTPGTYMPIVETISHLRKPLKIREPQPVIKRDINLRDEPDPINKKIILAIALVIAIALVAWGIIHFVMNTKASETKTNGQPGDTVNVVHEPVVVAPKETVPATNVAPTVVTPVQPTIAAGPNDYKAIFETTADKRRALDRLVKLRSYKIDVHLETADSVNFKLWVPIIATPADTLHKRDSLSKYFGRLVKLEKL